MNFFLFFVFGFLSKHRKVTQTRHTKPHHIAGLEYIVRKIIVINIVSGPQNHNDDCCSCHFVTQQTLTKIVRVQTMCILSQAQDLIPDKFNVIG